jgi:uncharacterized SAM-binding protein YcdF (DUF218 family)
VSPPSRRHPFRATVLLTFLIVVAIGSWFGRAGLLRGAAEHWIVSDPLVPSDAMAILGGGVETRPFAAAEYYHNGLSPKVIVSNVRINKVEALGVLPLHTDLNRAVLIKLGVPETKIETFGTGLSNTYEEAVALRDWAVLNNARSIIVPTESFSSRRVRWILNHELATTGTAVRVVALDDPLFSRAAWWKSDIGIISFQNETIKYIYYRIAY